MFLIEVVFISLLFPSSLLSLFNSCWLIIPGGAVVLVHHCPLEAILHVSFVSRCLKVNWLVVADYYILIGWQWVTTPLEAFHIWPVSTCEGTCVTQPWLLDAKKCWKGQDINHCPVSSYIMQTHMLGQTCCILPSSRTWWLTSGLQHGHEDKLRFPELMYLPIACQAQ